MLRDTQSGSPRRLQHEREKTMSSYKSNLAVGQWVEFYRTHDKHTKLRGKIARIHPGADDLVDVRTTPGNGSVSRLETASASDVTVIERPANAKEEEGEKAPAGGTTSAGGKA
jgi:hypothetical protein